MVGCKADERRSHWELRRVEKKTPQRLHQYCSLTWWKVTPGQHIPSCHWKRGSDALAWHANIVTGTNDDAKLTSLFIASLQGGGKVWRGCSQVQLSTSRSRLPSTEKMRSSRNVSRSSSRFGLTNNRFRCIFGCSSDKSNITETYEGNTWEER